MDKYNKLDFALSWREWFVVQFSALWQGNTYLYTQSMGFFAAMQVGIVATTHLFAKKFAIVEMRVDPICTLYVG